jgi:O-antigen/teichoic acid export membrane protein
VTDLGLWTIGAREIAKRPAERSHVIGTLLTTGALVALAAMLVGYASMFVIYRGHVEREAIALLLLTLPLSAPVGAVSAYFIAEQKAYVGTIASALGAVVMLGLLLLVVALDLGFTAVVMAYLASGLVFGGVMIAFSVGRVNFRPALDVALSRQLLRWAVPLGGFLFTNALYAKLDVLLLGWLSTKAEVALYGLAFKVVDTLVVLPGYVTITLLPEFARLTENRDRLDEVMQKAFTVMQVATVPMTAFFLVLAPEISEVLGGSDFRDAAPILAILSIGVALIFLMTLVGQGMIAVNRQATLFRLSLIGLGINAVLNLGLIPPFGAEGAAIAFVGTELLSGGLLYITYARIVSRPRFYRPLPVLAAGGAMAAVAALARLIGAGPAVPLVVGGVAGGAAYAACLYAFRAMPDEIHAAVVGPVLRRLRPAKEAA